MKQNNMTLEEKSYIYGLLLADGNMHLKNSSTFTGQIQLEINEEDEDIVDKLCRLIPYATKNKRVRDTNFKKDYHSVKFRISRQEFIKEMVDFGFAVDNKSYNARPPIQEYDTHAFWRGFMDGDGSLGVRKVSNRLNGAFLSLTTKSELLKNEFCNYLHSITGKTYNPKRNKRDGIYNIGCGGHSACKVLKEIYKNSTIHLDRKYQKYLECMSWELENSKPKRNTSGVVGVGINRTLNKWMAYINIDNKNINLGTYEDVNDAIIARLKAEKKYFGDFALQKHLFKEYGLGE